MFHFTSALVWQFVHITVLSASYLSFRVPCIQKKNDLFLKYIVQSIQEAYSIDLSRSIHIIQRLALIIISGLTLAFVMHAKLLALHVILFILIDVAVVLRPLKSPSKTFWSHIGFRIMIVCVVLLSSHFEKSIPSTGLTDLRTQSNNETQITQY